MKPIEQLDALREFLSHHLTLRGLEEFEGYIEHFNQLEAENEALRDGIKNINWRAKTESLDGHLRNVVIEISDALLAGEQDA